jgi:hypothetical protein
MLIGPKSTKEQQELQKKNTILEITLHNLWLIFQEYQPWRKIQLRDGDLRPYALYGDSIKLFQELWHVWL